MTHRHVWQFEKREAWCSKCSPEIGTRWCGEYYHLKYRKSVLHFICICGLSKKVKAK